MGLVPWAADPGAVTSPLTAFPYDMDAPKYRDVPLAWRTGRPPATSSPGRWPPNTIKLDPRATYSVRAVFGGRCGTGRGAFCSTGRQRIPIPHDGPPVQTFPIPHEATAGGRLQLTWLEGGVVAEVWLIRNTAQAVKAP